MTEKITSVTNVAVHFHRVALWKPTYDVFMKDKKTITATYAADSLEFLER